MSKQLEIGKLPQNHNNNPLNAASKLMHQPVSGQKVQKFLDHSKSGAIREAGYSNSYTKQTIKEASDLKFIEEEKMQKSPAPQRPPVMVHRVDNKINIIDEFKTPEKLTNRIIKPEVAVTGTTSGLKCSALEASFGSEEDSLTDNENSYSASPLKQQADSKQLSQITFEQRSGPRIFPNVTIAQNSLTFCVYGGNFPQVVREALALRRNAAGQPVWLEVQPITDTIMGIDFVWKPVSFTRSHGFDMMAKRVHMRPERPFAYSHFENISILTSKSGLIRRLREYYERSHLFKGSNYTYESSMAFSFITPTAEYLSDNPELQQVRKFFHRFEKCNYQDCRLPARQLARNIWIVKPENENRGRGIEIVTGWKELVSHMLMQRGDKIIIQKYIERPLLFYGRKFDIRVLALIDTNKNFYLYKPCYLRTSSDEYSLTKMSKFIHLTNNCFQMHSQNYENHEKGNQLPYAAFLQYLDQTYQKKYPDLDKDHIMQRMIDLMIDCHLSAVSLLDPRRRPGFKFEIVGFDFILDEDLRVWLIEVNTCPFMGPVLTSNHPNFMLDMLDDSFKLTVDKYFLGQELSPEDASNQTEYECIWSSERGINKRSNLGLQAADQEALQRAQQWALDQMPAPEDGSAKQLPKKFQKYLRRCQEYWNIPASLYPSNRLHQKVIRSQFKYTQKYLKQRQEEMAQHQRLLKMRNAKYLHLSSTPYPPTAIGTSISNQRSNFPAANSGGSSVAKKLLGVSNHHSIGQSQLPKFLRNKMLSHIEEPITLACSATPTVDPLPEAAKKDLSALDSAGAGGETKQQVLEKSRRSSKWQSSKANFALPKTQPGRHLANVQKEGGERIVPRNYEFDLGNNSNSNGGQYNDEFSASRPSEKRISSAGDISAYSSTANRQKSCSKLGVQKKNLISEPQKITLGSRHRQNRIQEQILRAGAASGIDIRRKSKDNKSRKSYAGRISPATISKVCNSQQTWNKNGGEPAAMPASRLQNGKDLESFDASEEYTARQEQSTLHAKQTADPNSKILIVNDSDTISRTNNQTVEDRTAGTSPKPMSLTQQSIIQRKQSTSKATVYCQKQFSNRIEELTTTKVLDDEVTVNNHKTYASNFSIQNENHKYGGKASKSLAPGRAKKNTQGCSYIDFAQLTEQAAAHITPKNAQIILPLQGQNGAIQRATQKNGKQPGRGLIDYSEKRLAYQKSINPLNQPNHLQKARENYYHSKITQFRSDVRSDTNGAMNSRDSSGQRRAGRDNAAAGNGFTTIKFGNQTDAARKVAKLPDKSPPLFSKALQGISPVLTQTNRKKSCLGDPLDERTAKDPGAAIPLGSSSSLLQGFPLALQQEVRAYQQHHSNFSFMLKQTMSSAAHTVNEADRAPGTPEKRDQSRDKSSLMNRHDSSSIIARFNAQGGNQTVQNELSRNDDNGINLQNQNSVPNDADGPSLTAEPLDASKTFTKQMTIQRQEDASAINSPERSSKVRGAGRARESVSNQPSSQEPRPRILPQQGQYPQFGAFLQVSQRMIAKKKVRETNKSLNKKMMPPLMQQSALHGYGKTNNQISQRSLRAPCIMDQQKMSKNSELSDYNRRELKMKSK